MTFAEFGLSHSVLKGVDEAGYLEPTPIQCEAIPVILRGQDVLGGAQTGTGKTAAFALPMLDILGSRRARARMPRSLVLEPTRELAAQVVENFVVYGKYQKLTTALLVGGMSFADQESKIDRGVDVLVATPGRLLDHFERGKLLLSDIKILVIDEADRMLDMGFIPDVERIVGALPRMRQTLMFSATILPEIRRLSANFLMNPKEISVAPPATPVELVTQGLAVVEPGDKPAALRYLIQTEKVQDALIFCNRKKDVDILNRSLVKHGFSAAALHGDMAQATRTDTLDRFKRGEVTLLVASDVAARGLDIEALSCVVNFDVPFNPENYIHRIGRTARAGLPGSAFILATPDEGTLVAAIAALIGRDIPRIEIPGLAVADFEAPDSRSRSRGRSRRQAPSRGRKTNQSPGRSPGATPVADTSPPAPRSTQPKPIPTARPANAAEPAADAVPAGPSGHLPAFLLRPSTPQGRKKKNNKRP